jgi:hypothetical protein
MANKHESHVTRFSWDASTYDEVCINCNNTDHVPGGWGELAKPCPNPVGNGGITLEEYYRRRDARANTLPAGVVDGGLGI